MSSDEMAALAEAIQKAFVCNFLLLSWLFFRVVAQKIAPIAVAFAGHTLACCAVLVKMAQGNRQCVRYVENRVAPVEKPSCTLSKAATCSLEALPLPVTDCLTFRGRYSLAEGLLTLQQQ